MLLTDMLLTDMLLTDMPLTDMPLTNATVDRDVQLNARAGGRAIDAARALT